MLFLHHSHRESLLNSTHPTPEQQQHTWSFRNTSSRACAIHTREAETHRSESASSSRRTSSSRSNRRCTTCSSCAPGPRRTTDSTTPLHEMTSQNGGCNDPHRSSFHKGALGPCCPSHSTAPGLACCSWEYTPGGIGQLKVTAKVTSRKRTCLSLLSASAAFIRFC